MKLEKNIPAVASVKSFHSQKSSPSQSFKKKKWGLIIISLLILIFLGVAYYFWHAQKPVSPKDITKITYWGLWEPKSVINGLIAEFEKSHPTIKVDYQQQSITDYRQRLQSALASGQGPDIFRFHNTWLPMLKSDLASVPLTTIEETGLADDYYPTVKESLFSAGNYYGLPLMIDTLALYYNKEIFDQAGLRPPTTWDEFRQTASLLTIRDENGHVQQAGAAMGNASNVDHWSDILALMILQNEGRLQGPYDNAAAKALEFFMVFSKEDQVWNNTLPASTRAFAGGKLAMYFAPSWRIINLRELNPDLDFSITTMPQLPGAQPKAWASYWAEGVSNRSPHQEETWQFLTFLSRKESLEQLYKAGSQVHYVGELYPRKSMAPLLNSDPLLSPFIKQASYAVSWYLCSNTGDNGINDNIRQYFGDAINRSLTGHSAELEKTVQSGVSSVLSKYRIISL